jgi:hypothetical protein
MHSAAGQIAAASIRAVTIALGCQSATVATNGTAASAKMAAVFGKPQRTKMNVIGILFVVFFSNSQRNGSM